MSDLSPDHSITRPGAKRGGRSPKPLSKNVSGSSSTKSYGVSMSRGVSSRTPPNSGGMFGSSSTLFGPSSRTTCGGLLETRVLDITDHPLTLIEGTVPNDVPSSSGVTRSLMDSSDLDRQRVLERRRSKKLLKRSSSR